MKGKGEMRKINKHVRKGERRRHENNMEVKMDETKGNGKKKQQSDEEKGNEKRSQDTGVHQASLLCLCSICVGVIANKTSIGSSVS